jgi:hypothetical protein
MVGGIVSAPILKIYVCLRERVTPSTYFRCPFSLKKDIRATFPDIQWFTKCISPPSGADKEKMFPMSYGRVPVSFTEKGVYDQRCSTTLA